jgi:PleD family two-component response regulator
MSIAEKIKVLIVDDQVTSRLLLSDALNSSASSRSPSQVMASRA